MSQILVPVSAGELLDKLAILEIKSQRIADPGKLRNVQAELELLAQAIRDGELNVAEVTALRSELKAVNERLWDIEDDIRRKEAKSEFDQEFIALARSVYQENDKRARLKREINLRLGSKIVEEKSYAGSQG